MSRKYRLEYESPHGKCCAEADSLTELEGTVSERIARMITPQQCLEGLSLDDAAKEVLRMYSAPSIDKRRNCGRTTIAKAGMELFAIRCYLLDKTISETVEWLRCNKQVSLSKSAVGRFYRVLFGLRIAPLGTIQARQFQASGNIQGE